MADDLIIPDIMTPGTILMTANLRLQCVILNGGNFKLKLKVRHFEYVYQRGIFNFKLLF